MQQLPIERWRRDNRAVSKYTKKEKQEFGERDDDVRNDVRIIARGHVDREQKAKRVAFIDESSRRRRAPVASCYVSGNSRVPRVRPSIASRV